MSTEIRYFTKSKKGNTEKLAQAVAKAVKLPALDVTHDLSARVDRLFLVNAMYASNIDREVKAFLTRGANVSLNLKRNFLLHLCLRQIDNGCAEKDRR